MLQKGFIIAIDGPVGSGKGTTARVLAKDLTAFYLSTGMFYRSVTLYCLENAVNYNDESAVTKILTQVHIKVTGEKTLLNDKDVTLRLKEKDVDQSVGIVSNYPAVREYVTPQQRETGDNLVNKGEIVIVEGRDIATKVFPDAEIKLYLTASIQSRAERRLQQMKDIGITGRTFDEVFEDIKQRDQHDMYGKIGYLVSEPEKFGYTIIDTTHLTIEQTQQVILNLLKHKGLL